MSDFNPSSYIDFIAAENRREEEKIRILSKAAKLEAERLAALFADKAGVEQVILFGSLAEGTVREISFDIDIAIVGGSERNARLIAEESEFPVDISDFEELPEHIRRRINKFGVVLYP